MSRITRIRLRRARLTARATLERERLGAQLAAWEAPLALLDQGVAAVRAVRRHPEWLIAAAFALAVVRPRRVIAWLRRGFVVWRSWRRISQAARDFALR